VAYPGTIKTDIKKREFFRDGTDIFIIAPKESFLCEFASLFTGEFDD
jgi:hypothetical protein